MQIKTFQAKDMAEALRLVKAEFGPDAMILTSKKLRRKGLFSFFAKPYYEVTALLDSRPTRADYPVPEPPKEPARQTNTREEFQNSMLAPLARELKELRSRVEVLSAPEEKVEPFPAARKPSDSPVNPVDPRFGVEELKQYLIRAGEGEKGGSPGKPVPDSAATEKLRGDIEELKKILLASMGSRKEQESAAVPPVERRELSAGRRDLDELKQLLALANGSGTARPAAFKPLPAAGSGAPSGLREGKSAGEFPTFSGVAIGAPAAGRQTQWKPDAGENRPAHHHCSEADDLKVALQRFLNLEPTADVEPPVKTATVVPLVQEQAESFGELLRTNGVGEEEIELLLAPLRGAPLAGESHELLRERLREAIMAGVVCAKQVALKNDSPRIMAFVGPTGVGKTTTIAKLAALAVKHRVRVSIITTDTYRIGAVDQLKAYAAIMGLPFAVAESPAELAAAIDANSDKQLIFIDTSGRNPRDQERLLEMKEFLEVNPEIETHLCLAATTRDRELEQIFARFSILPVGKVLFTKLDESESFGCIINMHLKNRVPLSYFTTGQRVPEDLLVATPKRVADLVLGEMTP